MHFFQSWVFDAPTFLSFSALVPGIARVLMQGASLPSCHHSGSCGVHFINNANVSLFPFLEHWYSVCIAGRGTSVCCSHVRELCRPVYFDPGLTHLVVIFVRLVRSNSFTAWFYELCIQYRNSNVPLNDATSLGGLWSNCPLQTVTVLGLALA